MAVYDAHHSSGNFLWRVMGRDFYELAKPVHTKGERLIRSDPALGIENQRDL